MWDTDISGGIGEFVFEGCKDDIPFFYYDYVIDDYASTYYLHYVIDINRWVISDKIINDITGVAECENENLEKCTYGEWQVLVDEDGDSDLIVDESMGYDSNCDTSATITTGNNCNNNDQLCASWELYFYVSSSSDIDNEESNIICNDEFESCITASLLSEWSEILTSNLICHNNYDIIIKSNITFSGPAGYEIYSQFSENFDSIINSCVNNSFQVSNDIYYSNLIVCDDCQFISTQSDENENGIGKFGVSFVVISLVFMFCALLSFLN